ncbi:hypothetical protein BGX38DRAFT_495727 [Terfezia claveryi]|nr:hypothetical protein BGX38DRAFT_495727 [Terfezia claveryi]
MGVLRRVEANVIVWGFGAAVAVGKAVGVECEVWISVILGGGVEEEGEGGGGGGEEEEEGGGEEEEEGGGEGAPFGGDAAMGRPRWYGLA